MTVALHFADGQVEREAGTIAPLAGHPAANTDDLRNTGLQVRPEIAIVFAVKGLGHEYADIVSERLVPGISEEPTGGFVCSVDDAPVVDRERAFNKGVEDGVEALPAPAQLYV